MIKVALIAIIFMTGCTSQTNAVLDRVEHVEYTTSRLCAKLTCAIQDPDYEECVGRCWTAK